MTHIYGINESAASWVEKAQAVTTDTLSKHAASVDGEGRFPTESMAALADAGLLGLCVPADAGGAGEGPATFAAVVETLAQGCSSTAMVFVMHTVATQSIANSATLANKAALLAEIAAGKHLTTLALSEKGSRSNFWAPVSKIVEAGGSLKTNAYKSWVTSAHHIQSVVCSGQKPGAASPAESTLYLVDMSADTARPAAGFVGLGLRGNDSCPVSLEDHVIAQGDLLTEQGAGAPGMLEVILPWFNVGTSSMAHGLCLATVAATSAHLQGTDLKHMGTQLRDLPNLRARLADMYVRTERSRALLGHTLAHMAAPSAVTPLYVLSARHSALQVATEVTDLGMKACGGAAFSKHLGIERLFRDARAGWVMAPTVDHSADFIGRALTGMELF
jgi:alkylation response protein AidB-like acyl-CoA dehydrogenase